jgi:putative ABC transport system permease protein
MRFWFRKRGDEELDEEIRAHLAMAKRDRIERGENPGTADQGARRELGNELLIKEVTREMWGWGVLERLAQDFRYAVRQMRRNPGFTAIAVLTLTLGFGATTAIFTVVQSVLLRPLAYENPEKLVRVYESLLPQFKTGSVSYPNLLDLRAQARSFSLIQAYNPVGSISLQDTEEAERVPVAAVEARMFELLGASAILGRTFQPGEDQPEAPQVVILGEALWRRRFGASPSVLGRTLKFDSQPYVVVGVMPESFRFPPGGSTTAELWTTLRPIPRLVSQRRTHYLSVLGRLAPGVELASARKELEGIGAQLAKQYSVQEGRNIVALPLNEVVVGDVRPALLMLMGAVALVLLMACVNVSNLLLARSLARRQEVLTRIALGASRMRILRQFLVESLLLAMLGGGFGLLLSMWGVGELRSMQGLRMPRSAEWHADGVVYGFLAAASILTSAMFGLAPALNALRAQRLQEPGRGVAGQRQPLKAALVAIEVALALILLAGAGLLMKSFLLQRSIDSGIRAQNVLTLQVAVSSNSYSNDAVSQRFYEPVRERVLALPGVREAGWISALPLQTWGVNGDFVIQGRPPLRGKDAPMAEQRVVSSGYFQSLGIPLFRGREFDSSDTRDAPLVVLVNRALADRYFGKDDDPLGRQLLAFRSEPATIVGIVANTRQTGLREPPQPEIYIPVTQYGNPFGQMSLVVSTELPPESLVSAVRGAIAAVDRGIPVSNVKTMERVVSDSLADRSLYTVLLGIFAAVALVLASAGIYGTLSFLVSQRTQEIGVRMALGATKLNVFRLIAGHSLKPVLAGMVVGIGGALAAARLLKTLLYGVAANDAVTFAGVCLVMLGVAILASLIPVRQAVSVDPAAALRND